MPQGRASLSDILSVDDQAPASGRASLGDIESFESRPAGPADLALGPIPPMLRPPAPFVMNPAALVAPPPTTRPKPGPPVPIRPQFDPETGTWQPEPMMGAAQRPLAIPGQVIGGVKGTILAAPSAVGEEIGGALPTHEGEATGVLGRTLEHLKMVGRGHGGEVSPEFLRSVTNPPGNVEMPDAALQAWRMQHGLPPAKPRVTSRAEQIALETARRGTSMAATLATDPLFVASMAPNVVGQGARLAFHAAAPAFAVEGGQAAVETFRNPNATTEDKVESIVNAGMMGAPMLRHAAGPARELAGRARDAVRPVVDNLRERQAVGQVAGALKRDLSTERPELPRLIRQDGSRMAPRPTPPIPLKPTGQASVAAVETTAPRVSPEAVPPAGNIPTESTSPVADITRAVADAPGLTAEEIRARLSEQERQRIREDVQRRPPIDQRPLGTSFRGNPVDMDVETRMPVADLTVDPKRMQFKTNADATTGVTNEERLTEKGWDPNAAGVLLVWKDPADGKTYVVNGHHRVEFAQRVGQPDVMVRFIDAQDAGEARSIGALTNIREGRGKAIDVAKLMKNNGWDEATLRERGFNPNNRTWRDGIALSKLSPGTLESVSIGDFPESYGVSIGRAGVSEAAEAAVVRMIRSQEETGRKVGAETVYELANEAKRAEEVSAANAAQGGFDWGNDPAAPGLNTLMERAQLRGYVRKALAQDRQAFSAVTIGDRAERLSKAGAAKVNLARAEAEAMGASEREALFGKLVDASGPINDAIQAAATELATGGKPGAVRDALLARVKQILVDERRGSAVRPEVSSGPRPSARPSEPDRAGGPPPPEAGRAVEVPPGAESVSFTHDNGEVFLASADPSKPGRYRVTKIDAAGTPVGHTEFENFGDAVLSASGEFDTKRGAPVGRRGGRMEVQEGAPPETPAPTPSSTATPGPSSFAEGDFVRIEMPTLHGKGKAAGRVTRIMPDGRVEVKLQGGGYQTRPPGELTRVGKVAQSVRTLADVTRILRMAEDGEKTAADLRDFRDKADQWLTEAVEAQGLDLRRDQNVAAVEKDIVRLNNRIAALEAKEKAPTSKPPDADEGPGYVTGQDEALKPGAVKPTGFKNEAQVELPGGMAALGELLKQDAAPTVDLENLKAGQVAELRRLQERMWKLGYGESETRDFLTRAIDKAKKAIEEIDKRIDGTYEAAPSKADLEDEGQGSLWSMPLETKPSGPPLSRKAAGELVRAGAGDIQKTYEAPVYGSGKGAKHAAKNLIRAAGGQMAQSAAHAEATLRSARKTIDRLSTEERLDFINRMEHGDDQAVSELQPIADVLRTLLDDHRRLVQRYGRLSTFIEDYFPHIWKKGDNNSTIIQTLARRPLEGSKSFLKKRSIPTIAEGIEAGLVPVTDNPIDLAMLKIREMDKWILAQNVLRQGKAEGIVRFIRAKGELPAGWKFIEDPIGTVWGPDHVTAWEGFDELLTDRLNAYAKDIGATVKTVNKIARHPEAAGVAHVGMVQKAVAGREQVGGALSPALIERKFGGPETVITHEIGHILDAKYGLSDVLKAAGEKLKDQGYDPLSIRKELAALADLRFEGTDPAKVPDAYRKYVRQEGEKVANLVHAYLHAPELMRESAPNVWDAFEDFLDAHPEVQHIRDIRPSLVLGSSTTELPVGGDVRLGRYAMPVEAAKVLERHLAPGLAGRSALFDAYRWVGNSLNQTQLGLSGFHAGTSAINAVCSKVALALEHAAEGRPGPALKAAAEVPLAWVTDAFKGGKVIRAYEDTRPGAIVLNEEVNRIVQAGGRVAMDQTYHNASYRKFVEAARQGNFWGAAKSIAPAAIEAAAKPIMEVYVPRLKVAAFLDLAAKDLERLGPNASLVDVRSVLGEAWDSIDNRFGQLVYDNLFANRVIKDLGMASVRSLGWNLGTVREHGYGFKDIFSRLNPKNRERTVTRNVPTTREDGTLGVERRLETTHDPYLSHATAYFIGMSFSVGLMGAFYQLAHTGEWPSEARDYFFPKTGGKDQSGRDERVSFPSYMKDLSAFSGHPFKTVGHKIHPLPNLGLTLFNNEDYFGNQVRNPDDPYTQQAADVGLFVAKEFTPISFRSFKQREEADPSWVARAEGAVGISPAPASVKRSAAEQKILDYSGPVHRTKAEADAAEQRRALVSAIRTGDQAKGKAAIDSGLLSRLSIKRAGKTAYRSTLEGGFSRLTIDQALRVWDVATDDERELLRDDLVKKYQNGIRNVAPAYRTTIAQRYQAAMRKPAPPIPTRQPVLR